MNFEDIPEVYRRINKVDFDTIKDLAHGTYLEVGTLYGASACAAAHNASWVITIDAYTWLPKLWDNFLLKDKILSFKGTSQDYRDSVNPPKEFIDVLFIDGAHEYEYVYKDCEALVPLVKRDGLILFHDYNQDNKTTLVSVAVDTYLRTINHVNLGKVPDSGNMLKVKKL